MLLEQLRQLRPAGAHVESDHGPLVHDVAAARDRPVQHVGHEQLSEPREPAAR